LPCPAARSRRRAPAECRGSSSSAHHLAARAADLAAGAFGEAILLLKSTPARRHDHRVDLMGAANIIRAKTFRVYEPLFVVAAVYVVLAILIALVFRWLERRVPAPR
jgi:ABC-type arginine/histidine transport system permease subunit